MLGLVFSPVAPLLGLDNPLRNFAAMHQACAGILVPGAIEDGTEAASDLPSGSPPSIPLPRPWPAGLNL